MYLAHGEGGWHKVAATTEYYLMQAPLRLVIRADTIFGAIWWRSKGTLPHRITFSLLTAVAGSQQQWWIMNPGSSSPARPTHVLTSFLTVLPCWSHLPPCWAAFQKEATQVWIYPHFPSSLFLSGPISFLIFLVMSQQFLHEALFTSLLFSGQRLWTEHPSHPRCC